MKVILLAALFSLTIHDMMSPTSASCGKFGVKNRIVPGKNAEIKFFPWEVKLERIVGGRRFRCAGTLISKVAIITAAHCVWPIDKKTTYTATLGVADLDYFGPERLDLTIPADNIRVPPCFSSYFLVDGGDIALLKVESPIALTKHISPICISKKTNIPPLGSELTIAGWGVTNTGLVSRYLKYAKMKSISNAKAQNVLTNLMKDGQTFTEIRNNFQRLIPGGKQMSNNEFREKFLKFVELSLTTDKFVITYNDKEKEGPCKGDSGSSLIYYEGIIRKQAYLAGVLSFEIVACTLTNQPGVVFSTKVSEICNNFPDICT